MRIACGRRSLTSYCDAINANVNISTAKASTANGHLGFAVIVIDLFPFLSCFSAISQFTRDSIKENESSGATFKKGKCSSGTLTRLVWIGAFQFE